MSQAVILLSGGIDSAACLYWAIRRGYLVTALSFNYHLRPRKEREAAQELAKRSVAKLIEVPVPFLKELVDLRAEGHPVPRAKDAPEGYLPARNLIFYAIATYYAEVIGADRIVGGHLAHDAEAFPDATAPFFQALEQLVGRSLVGGGTPIKFELPFSTLKKSEVVQLAHKLEVPLELTWSCYGDADSPCRTCVSCLERAAAFSEQTH